MKIPWILVVLLCLLAGALLVTGRQRSSTQEAALQAAIATNQQTAADWKRDRDSLLQLNAWLRTDSLQLARQAQMALQSAATAHRSVDSLLGRLRDTTLTRVVGLALASDSLTLAACANTLTNCEQRAANAEARASGDSMELAHTSLLLKQTSQAWQSALHPSLAAQFWNARTFTIPLTLLVLLQALKR